MIFGSTAGTTRFRGLCVGSLVENGVFGAGARFIEQVLKFDMVVACKIGGPWLRGQMMWQPFEKRGGFREGDSRRKGRYSGFVWCTQRSIYAMTGEILFVRGLRAR
jgi:hypothetical protein